jgi:hypothetical protein
MKQQINEIRRMQQLAGVKKQLNENINNINEVESLLKRLVDNYISETLDVAGEDLDWGAGVTGFENERQLIQDFIDYIAEEYPEEM